MSVFVVGEEECEEYICLVGQIKEQSTGQLFRDHCYIKIRKVVYQLLEHSPKYSHICFVASVYRYSKMIEIDGYTCRRFQFGLSKLVLQDEW